MTIAACYLSTGALVLGADSTTTVRVSNAVGAGTQRHFNYGQKIFEIGDPGTLAVMTWGLATLVSISYRTLIARLSDALTAVAPTSVQAAATRWRDLFRDAYDNDNAVVLARNLSANPARTPQEEAQFRSLAQSLQGGFCVGGSVAPDRVPAAFEITFHPLTGVTDPQPIGVSEPMFWGWPSLMQRLLFGIDERLFEQILASGHWGADRQALVDLTRSHVLGQAFNLPLREAVDFVYASIYTTIKALKFSHYPPVCGGPIEIAAITSDRPFRWIRHKRLPEAILTA